MGWVRYACTTYSTCLVRQVRMITRLIKPLFPLHRNTGGLALSDIGIGRCGWLPAVWLFCSFSLYLYFYHNMFHMVELKLLFQNLIKNGCGGCAVAGIVCYLFNYCFYRWLRDIEANQTFTICVRCGFRPFIAFSSKMTYGYSRNRYWLWLFQLLADIGTGHNTDSGSISLFV